MIINAENLILGRLASYAAKQALLGEKIEIVNCEKSVVTGSRKQVFEKFKSRSSPTDMSKKPRVYKMPDMFVRRVIRGMLPWKRNRGRLAYKNIYCHIGIPSNLKEKPITLENAHVDKLKNLRYVYIKDVTKFLGNK